MYLSFSCRSRWEVGKLSDEKLAPIWVRMIELNLVFTENLPPLRPILYARCSILSNLLRIEMSFFTHFSRRLFLWTFIEQIYEFNLTTLRSFFIAHFILIYLHTNKRKREKMLNKKCLMEICWILHTFSFVFLKQALMLLSMSDIIILDLSLDHLGELTFLSFSHSLFISFSKSIENAPLTAISFLSFHCSTWQFSAVGG